MKSALLICFLVLTTAITFGQATANQPSDILVCDDPPGDGFAIFDLTQNQIEILGTQDPSSFDVGFFETQVDADANVNPIANPVAYSNISNPQQIYARVTNISNGTFDTTSFALIVQLGPNAVTPSPIEICDDNTDGFAIFDLTNKDAEIIGGDPDLAVTYHETELDAFDGVNALTSPYQNIVPFLQTVYARVISSVSACFVVVELDLVVYELPELNQPNNLFINEGDGDGFAIFDLTVNDAILGDGIPNAIITYYETEANANMLVNEIAVPTVYANTSNPQELYAAAQNGDTDCYGVISFIIATDEAGLPDGDNDLVPDAIEDINANGDLSDDDTDNDTIPNFQDDDDDGDGTRTADEDYNNNGNPTDDDTNNNRIPDYLDAAVTLNVSETMLASLRVYPNPTSNELSVVLGSAYDTVTITVFTIHGTVILDSNKDNTNIVSFDVSSFAAGVYFLKVATNDGAATIKFIKK